jgi:ABC-type enterobactin transport system permease subunit
VQSVKQALVVSGEILPAWQVLSMLVAESGGEAPGSPAEVFDLLAGTVRAYRGLSYDQTRLPGVLTTAQQ